MKAPFLFLWKSRPSRTEAIPWPATTAYNLLSKSTIFQYHYELVAKEVVKLGPEGKLLDVGTGPARLLIALRKLAPNLKLSGIYLSATMVE